MTRLSRFQRINPSAEMVMIDRMFNQEERASLSRDKRLALVDPGKTRQRKSRGEVLPGFRAVGLWGVCPNHLWVRTLKVQNAFWGQKPRARTVRGYSVRRSVVSVPYVIVFPHYKRRSLIPSLVLENSVEVRSLPRSV